MREYGCLCPLGHFPTPFFPLCCVESLLRGQGRFGFSVPSIVRARGYRCMTRFLHRGKISGGEVVCLSKPMESRCFRGFRVGGRGLVTCGPKGRTSGCVPRVVRRVGTVGPGVGFITVGSLSILKIHGTLSGTSLCLSFNFFPNPRGLIGRTTLYNYGVLASSFNTTGGGLSVFVPSGCGFGILRSGGGRVTGLSVSVVGGCRGCRTSFVPCVRGMGGLCCNFRGAIVSFAGVFSRTE